MSRSYLVSALFVLAAVVCVSGSSLDLASPSSLFSAESWPAPSSEMVLPSASSLIDEVNARHREFLMVNGATGATGVGGLTGGSSSSGAAASSSGAAQSSSAAAAPSSSAAAAPSSSAAAAASSTGPAASSTAESGVVASSTGAEIDRSQFTRVVVSVLLKLNRTSTPPGLDEAFCAAINEATGFLDRPGRAMTCSHIFLLVGGGTFDPSNPGRRLLATTVTEETLQMRTTFFPENDQDTAASIASTAYVAQVSCEDTVVNGVVTKTRRQCLDDNAIPGRQSVFSRLEANPTIGAVISSAVVTGPDAVETVTTPGSTSGANTASEGTARGTNAGYYVLGAVVLAFLIGALIYFAVHKAPAAAKEIDGTPARRGEEVAMEQLPRSAAAPAGASSALVPAGDDAGQMDYKSVFALKHNVLDKKDADEPADDNDVHFVLHQ